MSPIGTSRHFAATLKFGRFRAEADIRPKKVLRWIGFG